MKKKIYNNYFFVHSQNCKLLCRRGTVQPALSVAERRNAPMHKLLFSESVKPLAKRNFSDCLEWHRVSALVVFGLHTIQINVAWQISGRHCVHDPVASPRQLKFVNVDNTLMIDLNASKGFPHPTKFTIVLSLPSNFSRYAYESTLFSILPLFNFYFKMRLKILWIFWQPYYLFLN